MAAAHYPASMSQFSRDPRGPREYSSPQIRVRGADDFRRYTGQRLRLPNERQWFGPRIRRTLRGLVALAIIAGIGVAVYFGVSELVESDNAAAVQETPAQTEPQSAAEQPAEQSAAQPAEPAQETPAQVAAQPEPSQSPAEAGDEEETSAAESAPAQQTAPAQQQSAAEAIPVSQIVPSVSEMAVTPAQIDGADIAAERVTAEPIPSGIPRQLADGADYDPTEPATGFSSRWPIGTTLRLTRLPGATLLTDEEQEAVVGTQALVVVRATEASNTDLQLSPAAFDLIAVYGTERIIAVSVEVTAPPPGN